LFESVKVFSEASRKEEQHGTAVHPAMLNWPEKVRGDVSVNMRENYVLYLNISFYDFFLSCCYCKARTFHFMISCHVVIVRRDEPACWGIAPNKSAFYHIIIIFLYGMQKVLVECRERMRGCG
jgi:hypothetical protein